MKAARWRMVESLIDWRTTPRFYVWQKCWLLLFERLFQLEPFGLAYLVIETDAEEDAVLLVAVGGVFAMNEPDEWTEPSIWRLFS